MQTKKNIAATLKRAKEESGKSMEEFSYELEIAKSTLQTYMKGGDDSNPTINTLLLIAGKLHTTVTDMITDPVVPKPPEQCRRCFWAQLETLHPGIRQFVEDQLKHYLAISDILREQEKAL